MKEKDWKTPFFFLFFQSLKTNQPSTENTTSVMYWRTTTQISVVLDHIPYEMIQYFSIVGWINVTLLLEVFMVWYEN